MKPSVLTRNALTIPTVKEISQKKDQPSQEQIVSIIRSELRHLKPLLLTWINFNPSSDKLSHPLLSVEWNHLSILNVNGYTIEVWEWKSNFISHFKWMQLFIHAGIYVNLC